MKKTKNKAIVLFSGGLDSATTLAIAKNEGFECFAMTFRYGQRHVHEISCAQKIAQAMSTLEHRIVEIDLRALGGSALTDSTLDVPKDRQDMTGNIPITYVPARNTIFLSYASLGQRCWVRGIFISGSTPWITVDILIVVPNISKRLRKWPISPPPPRSRVREDTPFTPRSSS